MTDTSETQLSSEPSHFRHDLKVGMRRHLKRRGSLYVLLSRVRHDLTRRATKSRLRPHGAPEVIGPKTEIVIEGPPRSANTFSVVAFRFAQARPVNIAHHLLAVAHIKKGVQLGVPTVVLLRDPENVVLSRVATHPPMSLRQALREYVDFFSNVPALETGVVIAPFEKVTSSYGVVIRAVNDRFDTDFLEFKHTPANVYHVLNMISDRQETAGVTRAKMAIPSSVRSGLKDALRTEYFSAELRSLRRQAESLYDQLKPG